MKIKKLEMIDYEKTFSISEKFVRALRFITQRKTRKKLLKVNLIKRLSLS